MTARVLVVENDPLARRDLAEILVEGGYVVEQAANGREALQRLEDRALRPAVILLDLRTPEMNGWDFRLAQRADAELRHIPVVVVSGDSDVALHARRMAAAGYLRKPFGLDELFAVVRSSCGL